MTPVFIGVWAFSWRVQTNPKIEDIHRFQVYIAGFFCVLCEQNGSFQEIQNSDYLCQLKLAVETCRLFMTFSSQPSLELVDLSGTSL